MRRLFAAIGVDYVQWRALSRATVLGDFSALVGTYGHIESRRAARDLLIQALLFTLLSLESAAVAIVAGDRLLAATAATTLTGMMAALFALALGIGLVSAEDHAIVGFRPVSSRTYFVVRLTGMAAQVLVIAVLTGYVPTLAIALRSDASWLQTLTFIAALVGCALTALAGVLALFTAVLRYVEPAKLVKTVTWMSVLAGVALMAMVSLGFWYVADILTVGSEASTLSTLVLPRTWWLVAFPPAWFGSYVEIVRGTAGAVEMTCAAMSVLGFAACLFVLRGLSMRYAERIAISTTDLAVPKSSTPSRSWASLRDERRAVMILLAGHLKDPGMITNVASTIVFGAVFASSMAFGEWPADPFWGSSMSASLSSVFLPLFMIPTSVRDAFSRSTAYEASWIFFTTPADRARLVKASRDAAALFVLLPTLILLAGVFSYAFAHIGHGLMLTLFLAGASYLFLQVAVMARPNVPCSVPPATGQSGIFGNMRGVLYAIPASIVIFLLQKIAFRTPAAFTASLAAFAGLSLTVDLLTKKRVEKRARAMGYLG